MTDRRQFCQAGAAALLAGCGLVARAWADDDRWGASKGYPTGWNGGYERDTATRVGNYSGGFEQMLPSRTIRSAGAAAPLRSAPRPDLRYRWQGASKSIADYLASQPTTALAIARHGEIWVQRYGFDRSAEMRLTSWSMAKSVTSLLLGIAIDKGLIESLDDRPDRYVPALRDTLHGRVSMRHLVNMASGAAVLHSRDNATIYPAGLLQGKSADLEAVVRGWNARAEEPGARFNYNELCPLTIGMVLRAVSGTSLSEFAQQALWQPMGAEADATWQCDGRRHEFNCIGVAARVRDWLRLGQLVAQQGELNGAQIVSRKWLTECRSWRRDEQQVTFGRATPQAGYKAFMWHARADGTQPYFNGHHGQRVFIDMPTQTVLVHTAVDENPGMMQELYALFMAAVSEAS